MYESVSECSLIVLYTFIFGWDGFRVLWTSRYRWHVSLLVSSFRSFMFNFICVCLSHLIFSDLLHLVCWFFVLVIYWSFLVHVYWWFSLSLLPNSNRRRFVISDICQLIHTSTHRQHISGSAWTAVKHQHKSTATLEPHLTSSSSSTYYLHSDITPKTRDRQDSKNAPQSFPHDQACCE